MECGCVPYLHPKTKDEGLASIWMRTRGNYTVFPKCQPMSGIHDLRLLLFFYEWFIYLGCTGPFLLCRLSLVVASRGYLFILVFGLLLLQGLLLQGAWAQGMQTSAVVAHRPCAPWHVDLSRLGIEPTSPALASWLLLIEPPGEAHHQPNRNPWERNTILLYENKGIRLGRMLPLFLILFLARYIPFWEKEVA